MLFLIIKVKLLNDKMFVFHLPLDQMFKHCWNEKFETSLQNYIYNMEYLDEKDEIDGFCKKFRIDEKVQVEQCNNELNDWMKNV